MACSRQHLCQQGEINLAVGVIELAGGANQQLSGGARLNVKCHRGAACMGAGTVSQLYQLVAEQGAVTVGDRQLAFFCPEPVFIQQRVGPQTIGDDDGACAQSFAAV